MICVYWCGLSAKQSTGPLVFAVGLFFSYSPYSHFLPAYVMSVKVNVNSYAGGLSLIFVSDFFSPQSVKDSSIVYHEISRNQFIQMLLNSLFLNIFSARYWITYAFKNMSFKTMKLGNIGPTVTFSRRLLKASRFILSLGVLKFLNLY